MLVKIKYNDKTLSFPSNNTITIGGGEACDFVLPNVDTDELIRLIYNSKYNNYVVVNVTNNSSLTCNNKNFTKFLANKQFSISSAQLQFPIEISIIEEVVEENEILDSKAVEAKRIALIKELGFKISEYNENVKSATIVEFFLTVAMFILSVVSAFGITNFLLGIKVEYSGNILNLNTNFAFLTAISIVTFSLCLILKQSMHKLLKVKEKSEKLPKNTITAHEYIFYSVCAFLFVVYAINLFYYKSIPDFANAAFFISFFFVASLVLATLSGGYYKFQSKKNKQKLAECEYREDFKLLMKNYSQYIDSQINELSDNRIDNVKNNLLNFQLQSIVEIFVGILTTPFLAYGVSNTLASCFPEAASWIRVSGIRFSPIFLVLATFMIIFAFFSFAKSFTIEKQIKGSETIRFDGFFDYTTQGVSIFGIDSLQCLEHEKNVTFIIACSIIIIEFSMNVSYFINEIGCDVQGLILSIITALVPTALLIAETQMLSNTMYKIENYKNLLSKIN